MAMKKTLSSAFVAVALLLAASCTYDPSYSASGSYGFGHGYGYGGSSFSTSLFVGTGDPRWGYDPYTYSYYDYTRRSYYDPYLNGYYPIGYRPPVVYGVPHPYGWRPGRGYCPPPRRVTTITLRNYRSRESSYRRSDYGWASQVRERPAQRERPQLRENFRNDSERRNSFSRPALRENPSERLNFRDDFRPSRSQERPEIRERPQPRMERPDEDRVIRREYRSRDAEAPTRDKRSAERLEVRPIAPPDEVRPPQVEEPRPDSPLDGAE